MTLVRAPAALEANEEVAALIATLHATGQRLEELTGGEVDTVADRDGRTFLLGRAQEQLRHREAAKQAAVLNALPAHIALLDIQGLILSVNEAWRQFGSSNVVHGPGNRVGLNYLETCDSAEGDAASEAHQIADGIRSVLDGGAKSFSIEYACVTPTEQLWFLMTATPLAERTNGVVVMHLNITAQKRAEQERLAASQLLDNVVDNIPTAVQLKSVQDGFRILMWNKASEAMYGLSRDAAVGRTVHDLWPQADADRMHAADQELVANGDLQDFPDRPAQTRTRGIIRVHMRKVVLRDAAGKATHVLVIADDIAAQLAAQAGLRESEARFRSLTELSSDWFWEQDAEHRFVRFSGGDRVDGWGPDQDKAIGVTRWDLPTIEPLSESWDAHKAVLEEHKPFRNFEYRRVLESGALQYVAASGEPIFDAGGRFTGYRGVATDITKRKLADEELERTYKELVEASRQRGMAEVATNVLHNVGNVLNSVNVSASLVTDSVKSSLGASMAKVAALLREHEADLGAYITTDPKGRHIPALMEELAQGWLAQQAVVVKELESLRGNIDHIKEIVAMQQSHARVSSAPEMVSISDLVEESLRMNASGLVEDRVRIVREFEPVPPVSVEKHKVLQILINLVRNAKHACDGLADDHKRMTLRIAGLDGRIRISVSDNGAGIAPENLTRIFSHGFTTRKDGHGFGLHSGALAAAELGGSLRAHSDGPGKGATFTLEFGQRLGAAA